jgi:hypothetical protein
VFENGVFQAEWRGTHAAYVSGIGTGQHHCLKRSLHRYPLLSNSVGEDLVSSRLARGVPFPGSQRQQKTADPRLGTSGVDLVVPPHCAVSLRTTASTGQAYLDRDGITGIYPVAAY